MFVALVACNAILGIHETPVGPDDATDLDGTSDVDEGSAPDDATMADVDAARPLDGRADGDAHDVILPPIDADPMCGDGGVTCTRCVIAQWDMPNERDASIRPASLQVIPGDAGLPSDIVVDQVTGLQWQRVTPDRTFDRAGAFNYCACLTLGGLNWRVPTQIELTSLADPSFPGGIDPMIFPADPAEGVWGDHGVGMHGLQPVAFLAPGQMGPVRCVSPISYGSDEPRYSPVGDSVVLDTRTQLFWERGASSFAMAWDQAAAFCMAETVDGAGWRMPTAKELATLADPRATTPPLLDTTAFPNVRPDERYWSSTGDATNAWNWVASNNTLNFNDHSMLAGVRCVK
jgi:hypothetical protein